MKCDILSQTKILKPCLKATDFLYTYHTLHCCSIIQLLRLLQIMQMYIFCRFKEIVSNLVDVTDSRLLVDFNITTSLIIPNEILIYWRLTFDLDVIQTEPIDVHVYGSPNMCTGQHEGMATTYTFDL